MVSLKASGPQYGMDQGVSLLGTFLQDWPTLTAQPLTMDDVRFPLSAFAAQRERHGGLRIASKDAERFTQTSVETFCVDHGSVNDHSCRFKRRHH
jgi:hypothetical protein